MKLRIARSQAEIGPLRSAWERLYSPERHTIFQTFAWNRLAAEMFSGRERPHVIYAENAGGAALIPAAIASDRISFLGEALFDYRDVLTAGDGSALASAWLELARLGLPLSVPGLRFAADWREFNLRPFSEAPCIQVSEGAHFNAAHARAGRLVRRLERVGVKLKRADGSATELLHGIYLRKAVQFGSDNLFLDRQRVEFLLRAAALAPTAVDVFTLEAGEMIAALVTLRDGAVRRFYTTWFDDAWSHYSPGTALLFEVTRRSLAEGLNCDYMTGSQPHKRRFATRSVPLFRAEASAEELARIAGQPAERAA